MHITLTKIMCKVYIHSHVHVQYSVLYTMVHAPEFNLKIKTKSSPKKLFENKIH